MTFSDPFNVADITEVFPILFRILWSAPRFNNIRTVASCPSNAAQFNGVFPCSSRGSTCAPLSRRSWSARCLPLAAKECISDQPYPEPVSPCPLTMLSRIDFFCLFVRGRSLNPFSTCAAASLGFRRYSRSISAQSTVRMADGGAYIEHRRTIVRYNSPLLPHLLEPHTLEQGF